MHLLYHLFGISLRDVGSQYNLNPKMLYCSNQSLVEESVYQILFNFDRRGINRDLPEPRKGVPLSQVIQI